MGPKKPYLKEKLPTGLPTLFSVIFGTIFTVGLFELYLLSPQPAAESQVLGATTQTTYAHDITFVLLIITLTLTTILTTKLIFKRNLTTK